MTKGAAWPPFFMRRNVSMIDFSRNYFELFGLPQRFRFDPNVLDAAYRRLQSEVHPDRFASGTDQEKRLALQSSARINEAYRALKSPVERAQYLLSLHGIDALSETDTALPLDFLERQLERREVAAAAVAARDRDALAAVLCDVRKESDVLVTDLARFIDENAAFADARTHVRELKFLAKLDDDLEALAARLEDG